MLAQLLPHYQTECSHVLPPPPLYRGKLLPPLFLHLFLDRGLLLLPELVRGGRGADRNLRLVPAKKSSMCLLWSKFKLLTSLCCLPGHRGFLGHLGGQDRPMSPTVDGQYSRWNRPDQWPCCWESQMKKKNLWLFDGGVVPIAHGADIKASLPLLVSLLEELLHDPPNPHLVALQWFGWVGKVSTVDHVL